MQVASDLYFSGFKSSKPSDLLNRSSDLCFCCRLVMEINHGSANLTTHQSSSLLTCAGCDAALLVSALVKARVALLSQEYVKFLANQPKLMRGDHQTSFPIKPVDAVDDDDDGDEDDEDDEDGDEHEDEEGNPIDGKKNGTKNGPGKGETGLGGAQENGEEDDDEDEQEDPNEDEDDDEQDEDDDDDDDDDDEDDGGEEGEEEEDDEEEEEEDEEEEALQPPKKRKK